jgi:hypothetical protein
LDCSSLKWLRNKDYPNISTLVICYEWYAAWFRLFSSTDGSSAESASSSEEVVIEYEYSADLEWELSEGTCSEGKEILDLQPRFGLASRNLRQPRSRWFWK